MTRRTRWAVVLVLIGSMMTVLSPAAVAARPPVDAKIVRGKVELLADGSVRVPFRVRCQPPLQAFEIDVGVNQGGVFGGVTMIAPGIVPCDGFKHAMTVDVTAEEGSFGPGPATVGLFVGAFDPVIGIDVEGVDSATVRL
jgi:hypothetical protein